MALEDKKEAGFIDPSTLDKIWKWSRGYIA